MYKYKLNPYKHFQAIPSSNAVERLQAHTIISKPGLTKEDKKKRIFGSGFVRTSSSTLK